jgi:predicted HAD superfamily phosphohydrolase
MNGQFLKVGEIIKKVSTVGSGGENTYFAKVWCQLENRPFEISVVTVKPVDCRQTRTPET